MFPFPCPALPLSAHCDSSGVSSRFRSAPETCLRGDLPTGPGPLGASGGNVQGVRGHCNALGRAGDVRLARGAARASPPLPPSAPKQRLEQVMEWLWGRFIEGFRSKAGGVGVGLRHGSTAGRHSSKPSKQFLLGDGAAGREPGGGVCEPLLHWLRGQCWPQSREGWRRDFL